jgi:anti-sigma B factor antagonist
MTILKKQDKKKLTYFLEGRLDTVTSPQLETELKADLAGTDDFTLDFTDLVYLSSAGLRVILAAQKQMNAQKGTMKVCNVNSTILEVFEVTGFADILTIV